MSVVLVHGNPETSAVWEPLRAALGRDDVVCRRRPVSVHQRRTGGARRSRTTATG